MTTSQVSISDPLSAGTRLALQLPLGDEIPGGGDLRAVVALAQAAEVAGFDSVVVGDHVVLSGDQAEYPWGRFPYPADSPMPDPLVMLSAVATATSRITLGTGVLLAPLRPAALLAKMAVTIDALSGGRLELGVGVGWHEPEYTSQGLDFSKRGAMLTDYMRACRALWNQSPASFASDSVYCEPKSPRPGGPSVLFSGELHARNMRRIVELGDGWIPVMGMSPDRIREGVDRLREALSDAGRDPSGLKVRYWLPRRKDDADRPSVARMLESVPEMARIGVTDAVIWLGRFVEDPAVVEATMEAVRDFKGSVAGPRR